MEAMRSSKTSVYFYRTERRCNIEYKTLHKHPCVNLSLYISSLVSESVLSTSF
jgi:hypothetical protein